MARSRDGSRPIDEWVKELPALIAAVNKVLSDLQAGGTIADLAKAAGLTYLPPVQPAILGDELLKVLQK